MCVCETMLTYGHLYGSGTLILFIVLIGMLTWCTATDVNYLYIKSKMKQLCASWIEKGA